MTATRDPGLEGPDPIGDDEIDAERPARSVLSGPSRPARGMPRPPLKLLIVAGALALVALGAFAWRSHHRGTVVAQGLARADALLRADTAPARREADRLLEPLVELDPVRAGAVRGLALALMALDDGDAEAGRRAEVVLVVPGRAAQVPPAADLAYGALALSRHEAGTALSYAARVTDSPWAAVLQARVALLAGKVDVAREPLDHAVGADASFPAVQALRGDALRRSGHPAQAREAYAAALAASPAHARAAYGMAKLALAGAAPADSAREPLDRLLNDAGTLAPERARAAYLLASIEARAGRRDASAATIARSRAEGEARSWIERAVAEQADAPGYRVIGGAPASATSASDEDPPAPAPRAAPATAISPTFRLPEAAPRPTAVKPVAPHPGKSATGAAKPGAKHASAKPVVKKASKKPDAKKAVAKRAQTKPVRQAAAKPVTPKARAAGKAPTRQGSPAGQADALDAALTKVRSGGARSTPAQ